MTLALWVVVATTGAALMLAVAIGAELATATPTTPASSRSERVGNLTAHRKSL